MEGVLAVVRPACVDKHQLMHEIDTKEESNQHPDTDHAGLE